MSFDSLPECFQKCIFAAGESVGCSSTDVVCICTKDLPDATGTQLTTCVLNGCPLDVVPTAGDDFLAICAKVTGSASGSSSATTTTPPSSSVSRGTTPPGTTTVPTNAPSRTSSSASGGTSAGDAPGGSGDGSGSGSEGLSTGAKAGIGVGVGILVILLMAAAFLYGRRRRSKPSPSSEPGSGSGRTPAVSPGMALAPTAYEEDRTPELAGEKMVPELAGKTIVPELEGRAISELESERKTEPTPPYGAIAGTNETIDGSTMGATWGLGTNVQGTQVGEYTQGTTSPESGNVQPPIHTTTNFPYQPIELDPTAVSQRGYQTGP